MISIDIEDVCKFISASLQNVKVIRRSGKKVEGASSVFELEKGAICFYTRQKWGDAKLELCKASCIITNADSLKFILDADGDFTVIAVPDPRLAFILILKKFFEEDKTPFIHETAVIEKGAKISPNVSIDAFSFVSAESEIGQGTVISTGCSIEGHVAIGENCYLGSGVKIGLTGFGFEISNGRKLRMPHIGSVRIGDNVHIGSNCVIDRGTLSNTKIGDNVYINNLCHIAHNVEIKRNCTLNANVALCGSVTIGEECWIGPSSTFRDKTSLAPRSTVGSGTVVSKPLLVSDTYIGNPARPIK